MKKIKEKEKEKVLALLLDIITETFYLKTEL